MFSGYHAARSAILVLAIAFAALGAAGCSDSDALRSSVVIESLNNNEAIQSDVYSLGDDIDDPRDDYVPEDEISVIFRNTPLDAALTPEPNKPFGDVVITKYLVQFDTVDAELADFGGGMYLKVPTGQTVEAFVTAVPALYKIQPPLVYLQGGNGAGEITGVAHFTFWGKELQTGEEFVLQASAVCNFADFSDEN
jgi:hypothetical protein